ncbi:hypothetical protein [Yersinia intermedia]|uniref:hypothetical protein n=1 Tax=Yersinia intermedia TaxID=631 RepID=UPI0011A27B07|nr:hypothetical protein [Yersinia intermedia]
METNWIELAKLASSLFTGFFGAYFGAKFTLSKFKKEKIWDYQVQTYRNALSLIEEIAFWGLKEHASFYGDGMPGGRAVKEDAFSSSMRELAQIKYVGSIYFSPEFSTILDNAHDKFVKTYQDYVANSHMDIDERYYHEMAGEISNDAYSWLNSLNEQAGIDLGIKFSV